MRGIVLQVRRAAKGAARSGAAALRRGALVALTLRVAPERVPHAQGYALAVTVEGSTLEAHDAPGGLVDSLAKFDRCRSGEHAVGAGLYL